MATIAIGIQTDFLDVIEPIIPFTLEDVTTPGPELPAVPLPATTFRDIINDAISELQGAIRGRALSAEDEALGLRHLNRLISDLSLEGVIIPIREERTYTLTPGKALYVFESDLAGSGPYEVLAATLEQNGRESRLEVIPVERLAAITNKARQGTPGMLFYEPRERVTLSPVPNAADILHIHGTFPLTEPVNSAEDLRVPREVETVLIKNLAVYLAPSFQKSVGQELTAAANRSKAVMMGRYDPPRVTQLPRSVATLGHRSRRRGFLGIEDL